MIRIELPYPPTVNTYWRHIPMGGRVRSLISKRGRDYRAMVALEVTVQRAAKRLAGRLQVEIEAHVPDRRRRDIDNLFKALGDACTYAGVWIDDEQIDRLSIARRERIPGGRVVMTIREIAA